MEKLLAMIIANFRWRGRLTRSGLFISIGLFYAFGLLALPFQIVQAAATFRDASWLVVGMNGLLLVVGAAMAWNLLGATVRRLHDRGKSGLWLLLLFGPQAAVVAVMSRIPLSEQKMILLTLILGFAVAAPFLAWGMVEIFCLRGGAGTNRYGSDPLATTTGEPT